MTQTIDPQFSESLTRINGLILSEERFEGVLELVVSLTASSLPNTDGVSVTLKRDGRFTTAVYSNEITRRVDQWQYATGEGPCLQAIVDGEVKMSPDLALESRWPAFATMAMEEGVQSVLSVPLQPMGDAIGALNSYATKPKAFDEEHVEMTTSFAQQAAIVIANSVAYSSAVQANDQLREALESREIIGQAKGILMEREGCSAERAFAMLKSVSQQQNRKLRDVAREVVRSTQRR